jgi:uncharacterized protein
MGKIWYANGLRFTCLKCGKCCVDEGEYTEVYVTRDEVARMAGCLGLYPHEFLKRYVQKSDGFETLASREGACIMLSEGRCRIYDARPRQCRTWPFWPQNLSRRAWYGEVKKRCPGVGSGRTFSVEEIETILLAGGPVS